MGRSVADKMNNVTVNIGRPSGALARNSQLSMIWFANGLRASIRETRSCVVTRAVYWPSNLGKVTETEVGFSIDDGDIWPLVS